MSENGWFEVAVLAYFIIHEVRLRIVEMRLDRLTKEKKQ
jgi:hypothetical protein